MNNLGKKISLSMYRKTRKKFNETSVMLRESNKKLLNTIFLNSAMRLM